jgi:hypothetical protein
LNLLDRFLDRYVGLGLIFAVFGVPLAFFSWFVLLNTPLTALGLGCVVLGATLVLVPSSPVPRETVRAMVEGACVGVEAMLEEFDARLPCVYLPPREGRVCAYAPLSMNPGYEGVAAAMRAPLRVLSDAGGGRALMVFPPGSEIVRISGLGEESGIDEALGYVLVDFLEEVEGVKAVREGDRVLVEMVGGRVETGFPRYRMVLGSLPTSVAGCVLSATLGKPVAFMDEEASGKTLSATFRVLESVG